MYRIAVECFEQCRVVSSGASWKLMSLVELSLINNVTILDKYSYRTV